MLKHFFIILCFLSLVLVHISSCGPSQAELERKTQPTPTEYDDYSEIEAESDDYEYIKIKIIDSCEYISYTRYAKGVWYSGMLSKCNCKNPIHKNTK